MNTEGLAGHNVKFVTWNVRGLGGQIKRSRVFSHLKSLSTDIVFLQETHLRVSDHVRLRRPWIGQVFHSNFNSKSRGTAIVIHKRIKFVPQNVISDPDGRYVIVSGILYQTPVILVSVYAPNFDNPAFMTSLFSHLPNLDTHRLILGGDLNCTINPSLDRSQPKSSAPVSMSRSFSFLADQTGCVDPWRFLNPTAKEFSFFSNVHHVYSRIDYFFIDKALLSQVKSTEYSAIIISDHAPHILDLSFSQNLCRHAGGWKLNTGLLADKEFCDYISKNIDFFLETNKSDLVSPSLLWETFKAFIRGRIISFNAYWTKARKLKQQKLVDKILEIDRLNARSPNPVLETQRLKLQTEFDLLTTNKAEFLLKRTRATFYEHGDRAGRLLASQLRHQTASQLITQVYDSSNNLINDPIKINSEFSSFYSNLYKSEANVDIVVIQSFLSQLEIPKISPDIANSLDEPISLEEIASCILTMKNNKAPGPDGFPAEFFKKFSTQLSPLLLDLYNHSLDQGFLSSSLNQALISLILKKDKDAKFCGSYRPISLINNDIKLLAKVLAKRLEAHLQSIISDDQTGFILGRQLSSNIRRLLNVVFTPSKSSKPEMVISLDAEKAFDRVEWDYLFMVLQKFGFGPKIISWIRLLYSTPSACVKTNFETSPYFSLSRGTRQGCPLSPLLFALAIEPLSIALKSSSVFTGIYRGGREHRVSLYADDLLLYVSDPLNCIDNIMHLLNEFGLISGYKLNYAKSECFPVGDLAKQIPPAMLPFHMSSTGFRYLGVHISNSFKSLRKENFTKLVDRIKVDLQRWNNLPLSLVGRIESIKMNILPRILFLFQTIPVFLPKSFFKSFDSIISSYIWAGKPPRVHKSTLQRTKQDGGLALPNFLFYYWAANIQKIYAWCNSPNIDWCIIEANSCLSSSLSALVFDPNLKRPSKYTSNPIVLSSLKIWKQFCRHFKLNALSTLMPICGNHLFVPSTLDSTFAQLREKGLVLFHDLFLDDHVFASFNDLMSRFKISRSNLFRYFQLRDFAKAHFNTFPHQPMKTLIEDIMSLPKSHSHISSIYGLLRFSQFPPLFALKGTWERELGLELDEELWNKALAKINSVCICASLNLIQFKIVHRIHFTKAKLKKLSLIEDDRCNRCLLSPADHTHTFYTCPKLYSFWSSFFDTLSKALNVSVKPCPIIAIFGITPVDGLYNKRHADIIAFASLVARRRILLHWKSSCPPSNFSWLKDLMSFLHLEKINSIRDSVNSFYKVWNPIISFVETTPSLEI